jgi:TP901 family phage tail tape measure protein
VAIKLQAILTASDRATGVIRGAQAAAVNLNDRALKGLGRIDALNKRIGAGIKATVTALGVAGLALGGVGAKIIGTGASFEEAITAVGAVGLQTRDQIAPLEKEAQRLGATTKFTATQAANAMEIMAKAGFKNQEILAGVGGVLNAAAASGLEMAEVANHVSNVLKGMGLEATESARVADVLALASARTNSSIGSLGESMKNLAPVARQLNIPLEQAVASVALLQDVGLDASEAGTATATMLTKLAKPTPVIAAEMKKLGIAFEDASGNALGLPAILKNFDTAAKKTGGNMKVLGFFSDLVGLRGQKAALNLKEAFASGKLSSLSDELDKAAGVAQQMADLRMQNLKGDFELLKSATDGLFTSLFNTQSGPLRDIVKGTTQWVDLNKEIITSGFADKIKEWTPIVKGFGDGVTVSFQKVEPVLKGVGGALDFFFGEKVEGAQSQAYFLGRNITDTALAFVGFVAVTKLATFATFGFQVITKATRIAIIAYEGGVKIARAALIWFEIASKAGAASTLALSGASVIATGNLYRQRVAAFAAAGGVMKLAKAGAAAAAAYAAWSLAADQNEALKNENAGLGIGDLTWGLITEGKGFSEQVDEKMNREAKLRREREDQEKAPGNAGLDLDKMMADADAYSPDLGGMGLPAGEMEQLKMQLALMGSRYPAGGQGLSTTPPVIPPVIPPGQMKNTPAELRDAFKNSTEITIKAPEGAAEVTKKPEGAKVKVVPSGSPWFD